MTSWGKRWVYGSVIAAVGVAAPSALIWKVEVARQASRVSRIQSIKEAHEILRPACREMLAKVHSAVDSAKILLHIPKLGEPDDEGHTCAEILNHAGEQ